MRVGAHRVIDDGHQDAGSAPIARRRRRTSSSSAGVGLLGLLGHQHGNWAPRPPRHRETPRRPPYPGHSQEQQHRTGRRVLGPGGDEEPGTAHGQRAEPPSAMPAPAQRGRRRQAAMPDSDRRTELARPPADALAGGHRRSSSTGAPGTSRTGRTRTCDGQRRGPKCKWRATANLIP